jgi:methionyl-tRNA formyltransferase
MKIVFMGTPEFAVESLERIHHSKHSLLAVVTSPDKPAGRGMKLRQSAVKEYCVLNDIPCLQPEKLKDAEFIANLKKLDAEAFVVIAFRMLPQEIWSMPRKGTINIHASLLPDYRGAAPINHAIIQGEQVTGVSSFIIEKEIDTGDILLQKSCKIGKNETAGELHDKLKILGADLIIETLDGLENGKISGQKQAKPANKKSHQNLLPSTRK